MHDTATVQASKVPQFHKLNELTGNKIIEWHQAMDFNTSENTWCMKKYLLHIKININLTISISNNVNVGI